ncbi:MAG TPA: VOC family protein [Verrucomicrobiae bacterium]|nr:VOC family protein [Verrucomicrobiae bacterium]
MLLRTVVLDFAPDVHDAAGEFWRVALLGELRRGTEHPEYHVVEHPAAVGPVVLQRLGTGASRIHLDLETDDPAAEVARLLAAGATIAQRHQQWTVLRDPAGLLFCVVPAESADFADLAHIVSP